MAAQKPPSFKADKLYDFPTRETLVPALKVGALTGTTGLLTGSVSGLLLSSKTPTLFALASSLQWFLLGSTFWATRSTLLYAWCPPLNAPPTSSERLYGPYPNSQDRVHASTLAGGVTGGVIAGLVRGRRNILPATILWTLFGYVGQRVYNRLDAKHSEQVGVAAEEEAMHSGMKEERGFWDKVAEMKWSPMKKLEDEEYANILREKLLGIDAQIALVDEEMERLKEEESDQASGDDGVNSEELKK